MNAAHHPRERPGLSRRAFLARTAGAGLTASGLGALVSGCGPTVPVSATKATLPTPNRPVTWRISADNGPIPAGQVPGRGSTLQVYSWAGHVSPHVLDAFASKYGCQVQLSTFSTFGQALATLTSGRAIYDVLLGAPSYVVGSLVGRKLIMPLNHSYLPGIRNLWPRFISPYYDSGSRYTVPYTVYTTGLAWRKDLIDLDPYTLANGWEFPWLAGAKGKTAILDDYREGIGLALLKTGVTDINTADPRMLDTAAQALRDLGQLVGLRVNNGTSRQIATGRAWIHQAWSGQVAAAPRYLPAGVHADVIGYWFPPDGAGPVGNDTATVLRGAQNPALAHLFINYLLDPQNAMVNVGRIGYLQPLTFLTPLRLVQEGILPRSLMSTAVLSTSSDSGLKELELPRVTDALWSQIWTSVQHQALR